MLNEEDRIADCLDAILENDHPHDRLETLVIDGMSSDRSRGVVQEYAASRPNIRLCDNRKRTISSALNIGIQEARGQVIIRTDAHAVCASEYVRTCVRLLQTTEAASVGGVQRAVGTDYISEAIAIGMTTPFGVGTRPSARRSRTHGRTPSIWAPGISRLSRALAGSTRTG
jgi:glycosyltransferase involved in cell wall biosynthesis